jgi:hypothetical protein
MGGCGWNGKLVGGELGNDSGEVTCRHGEEVTRGQRKPSDDEFHVIMILVRGEIRYPFEGGCPGNDPKGGDRGS